jgi:parallel beta-helix repeat protein
VSAVNEYGETLASTAVTRVTTGTTSTVTVSWTAVVGAISYRIYGRTGGSELLISTVGAPTVSWTDTGWYTPAGALPGSNTTGPFTAAMVGQSIYIGGAGAAAAQYAGTISAFTNSGQVTVTPNASTTSANAWSSAGTLDTTAINAAIAALTNGSTLFFPTGGYLNTGVTIANKADVSITGNYGTLICTVEATQVMLVQNCARASVDRMRAQHATQTARTSSSHGIRLLDCTDISVTSNRAANTCGTGFFLENCYRGTITGNTVIDTLADGIHCTLRCSDIDVIGNRLFNVGDDGIAFVAYQKDGSAVTRCTATGNTIFNGKARGIAVIGASIISIACNSINSTNGAGVIVAQENSFSTFGPTQVTVVGNTIKAANTFNSPTNDHAGILIVGDSTAYPVDDIHIVGNTVSNSWRRDIFAVPTANGTVTNLVIENNNCFGPSVQTGAASGVNYAQIELFKVDSAVVRGNTCDKGMRHGILADPTVLYVAVQGNTITSPGQENLAATSFGIYIAAAACTVTPDNVVKPDGTKAALSRDIFVGNPGSNAAGGPLTLRDANAAPTTPTLGLSVYSSNSDLFLLTSGGLTEHLRGWEFLGSTVLGSAAITTSVLTVDARDELMITFRVVSLSAGDTVGIRFNGDTGANYWWRGVTSVKTATSGSAPALVDTFTASTTRVVLYPLSGTAQLVGTAAVTNRSATTKLVTVDASTGSAAAATVPTTLITGSGEWINTAAQITSVTMLTTGGTATMAAGSGFVVHGRNL